MFAVNVESTYSQNKSQNCIVRLRLHRFNSVDDYYA